jgi:pyridoxine kinase
LARVRPVRRGHRRCCSGIEDRGVLPDCDAVLSGYVGDASLGRVVLDAVARAKAANPRVIYCCDPVMGDVGRGFFVRPGTPELMRGEVVPADVITPNQFELEFLAGRAINTLDDALAAADVARALGPGLVLVTSLVRRDAPAGKIEMLAASAEGAWLVETPLLSLSVNGAGDVTSALFLAHLLRGVGTEGALSKTASSVYAVLEDTHRARSREIRLIAAQDAIADPPDRFPVWRLR